MTVVPWSMPTTRPDPLPTRPFPGRPAALACRLLLLALLLTTSGCFGRSTGEREAPPEEARKQLVAAMTSVLAARARGLREGDLARFRRTVDGSVRAFARRERTIFANYDQLPIAELGYKVDPTSIVRARDGWQAVVTARLRLDRYDALPVSRRTRFHFTGEPGGRLRIAGDRDVAWEERTSADVQPWDRVPVVVRAGRGVLGIFDASSAVRADAVIREVEAGIQEVSRVVPLQWARTVVVYALSDSSLLSRIDVPGGEVHRLDAVAFPVAASEGGEELAATRFLLHPRMLGRDPQQLGRLVRHELVHVALGQRDDEVPIWLSEGIAEWVSVQPIPVRQRLISRHAVTAAVAGPTALPSDIEFNGAGQDANYGLSWWAVEAIVDRWGRPMLWRLLETMSQASGPAQDDVLEKTLEMGEEQLAREAARRIVATYG